MRYVIREETIGARAYVGIRRKVKPAAIGPALGEILPAVAAFLQERDETPATPPMALYFEHDEVREEFDLLGGFFLSAPVAAEKRFEAGVIPAGAAAVTMHIGPYEKLGEAHAALRAHLAKEGRAPRIPCYDIYWSDPGEIPNPAEYRTEVVWPMAARPARQRG